MPRRCAPDHPLSPATCGICAWCVSPTEEGRKYRQLWGEPEPDGTVLPKVVTEEPPTPKRLRNQHPLITCPTCPKLAKFAVHAEMRVEDVVKLISGPVPQERWPKGWPTWEVTKKAHWQLADGFAAALPPYPEGRYRGRGIVIVAGKGFWAGAYVTVRMLKHFGWDDPIQVWHLGPDDVDANIAPAVTEQGVELMDMLAHPEASKCRRLGGFPDPQRGGIHPPFELKSFAVLHSPFAEVLSIDADNYPCGDVRSLFDDPQYRSTGGVYWPDLPHTEKWTRWGFWGVSRHGPAAGLETGQYLLDKRQAWGPLNLARFYDDHGDWCYGWGVHGDHGDKGPHRVGWARFRQSYAMFAMECVWDRFSFVQPGPDGEPLFVHRCRSKLSLERTVYRSTHQTGHNLRGGLPGEELAFQFLGELKER